MNDDELAAFLGGQAPDDAGDGPHRQAARHVRDLLADEAMWVEPTSEGADAVVEAIRAEPAAERVKARHRQLRPSRVAGAARPGRWRLVAVTAAAVVAVVAGIAAALVLGGGDPAGQDFAIAGTEQAPGASAVATVENQGSGVAIELDVHDLPPAEPGTYYQGWVKGPTGLVTVGTFHMRGGDDTVDLWAGVELDRYPTLTVTIQQEGAGQESSGEVVLTGEIVP